MATENTDKLWNGNYCKVMVANFMLHFAFYVLTPLLPLYLSGHFGATKDIIGLVLSGYTVTALLMRPFSGYIVDTFPRRKVLLLCFFLYFIFFGGYLMAGSLMLFAVVRTLHGGPFGASTVANSTVAIDVLPSSRRQEGIGFYGLSNNIATALAPTVGILTWQYTGSFDVLFWMAFVAAGIGLAVNATIQLPPRELVRDKRALSLDRFFLLRGWMVGLNILFFGICYGILSNYLAIYGKEVLGMTGGTGVFFFLLSSGLIIARLVGARSLREGGLTRNAAVGVVVSSVGYLLFVSVQAEWSYYLSALLIGLGNGHFWPAFQNMMINMAAKNERGTANSTLLTSWDLGVGIGVLLGGVVSEYAGYSAAFWTVFFIQFSGMLFYLLFTRLRYRPL